MDFGNWTDGSFLDWVAKTSSEYDSIRFKIRRASHKCVTVVPQSSEYYKILCYGCSRRLHLILEAIDSIFEMVPLNTIMRTKALDMRPNNRLELLYHALLVNVSGTMDNAMYFISKYYRLGLNLKEIQFFKKEDSRLYRKIKSKNPDLSQFLIDLKENHKDDLQKLRNTVCHRIVPYYSSCVRDVEGYNSFIAEWNSSMEKGTIEKSLDENPFELNSGTMRFEDVETDGYWFTSLHDSALRYCWVMLEVVNKAISLLESNK